MVAHVIKMTEMNMHNKLFIIIIVHLYIPPSRWHVTDQVFCVLCPCLSDGRRVKKSEELVINAVATINNLSFYQGESSVVRCQHTHISQCKTSVCVCVWTQPVFCICFCPSVISPSGLSFCHCSATKALAGLQYGYCFGGHTCFWKSVADQRRETLHHAAQRCDVLTATLSISNPLEADVVLMFLCVSGTVCGNPPGLQDPWCVFLCMWSSHQLICRPRQ